MSKAVILQHVPYWGAGRILTVFRDFGIQTDVRHLYKGDEVPSDLDDMRLLIVLGGPMSVGDIGSEKFPWLSKEQDLLKRCVLLDRATLGLGLGAQLLAHAGGGKVHPNVRPGMKPEDPPVPSPEYGWGPVMFPFPGGTEPIVMGLHDGAPMFHWHTDAFDLPRLPAPPNAPPPPAPPPPTGNALLSSSRLCKNQAFRFKTRLFGFQFHFELTPEDIEKILASDPETTNRVTGPDGESKVRQDTKKNYPQYSRLGDRIIKNFVQFLRLY